MAGFSVLARREALEIVRTWRIWVLPTIVLLFAIIGPPLARITPELLGSLAGGEPGTLRPPPATYADSYGQWIKNLSQIVLFALIIIYGGVVSAEIRGGTAAFILSKPVARPAFVAAKAVVHGIFITLIFALGSAITWLETQLIFGQAPARELWIPALLLLIFGLLMMSLMTLFSVMLPSAAGSAGAGIGVYALLAIGAIWKPLADYSPAGLPSIAASMATGQNGISPFWASLTSLALASLAVVLACRMFSRKEL